jgi:hypothetical protein
MSQESREVDFELDNLQVLIVARHLMTADDRIVVTGHRWSWTERARWIRLTRLCWAEPSEVQQGIGESDLYERVTSTSGNRQCTLFNQATSIT